METEARAFISSVQSEWVMWTCSTSSEEWIRTVTMNQSSMLRGALVSLLIFFLFLLKLSSYWKEEAGRGCCARQSWQVNACWWGISSGTSLWVLPKGHSSLIAPHMMQGTKSTFQSHLDHGLVLTACAMLMTLLWCQPQKLREKARRDCGVIWACLSIKFYTIPGHLSSGNNYLFHSSSCAREMPRQKTHSCLIRCHPKIPAWLPETKRYRDTQTDAIHFSLKKKCLFEEMIWTMKVLVVLRNRKGS